MLNAVQKQQNSQSPQFVTKASQTSTRKIVVGVVREKKSNVGRFALGWQYCFTRIPNSWHGPRGAIIKAVIHATNITESESFSSGYYSAKNLMISCVMLIVFTCRCSSNCTLARQKDQQKLCLCIFKSYQQFYTQGYYSCV